MATGYNLINRSGELQRNIIREIMEDCNWSQDFQQHQSIPVKYFNRKTAQKPVAAQITDFIKEEFKKLDK